MTTDDAIGTTQPDSPVGGDPEVLQVDGKSLVAKVKELMHEGNVRRIVIKNADGNTVLELPVTVGVIGVVLMPALAAVGAIAGLSQEWTLDVYRRDDTPNSAT